MSTNKRASVAGAITRLAESEVTLLGRIPWSSNATFLVQLDASTRAIYKPLAGEAPLSDFEPGLYKREVAAFQLSEAMGFGFVPPTIIREDAPHGIGSLQLVVAANLEEHYFTLRDGGDFDAELRKLALFDIIANNADRKAGHVLRDAENSLWAIDHGLCFHEEFKLRTVMWDFAHEPIDPSLLGPVREIVDATPDALTSLLTPGELTSLVARAAVVLEGPRFPAPEDRFDYPWPLI